MKQAGPTSSMFPQDWNFGARRIQTAAPGDAVPLFGSHQQTDKSENNSRRPSLAFLSGEGCREDLISSECSPLVTMTQVFGSLILSDNKLRKSATGKIVSDRAVSAFEQKRERRRSRDFWESDRRRYSINPRRGKKETPAMIVLRKASKQYNCIGFETAAISGQATATAGRSRFVPQAEAPETPRTPDSGSGRATRSSVCHPLIEASNAGCRAESIEPAMTVSDAYAAWSELNMTPGNTRKSSLAVEEAQRKSNISRHSTHGSSQEIIWKKDGSPSAWSYNHSNVGSASASIHNSDDGQAHNTEGFPADVSAMLPTLAEEHALVPGVGPSSQRLAVPEDPSGGWPWTLEASPTRSGFDAQETSREYVRGTPSPPHSATQPILIPKTRNTALKGKGKDRSEEYEHSTSSDQRSPSLLSASSETTSSDELSADAADGPSKIAETQSKHPSMDCRSPNDGSSNDESEKQVNTPENEAANRRESPGSIAVDPPIEQKPGVAAEEHCTPSPIQEPSHPSPSVLVGTKAPLRESTPTTTPTSFKASGSGNLRDSEGDGAGDSTDKQATEDIDGDSAYWNPGKNSPTSRLSRKLSTPGLIKQPPCSASSGNAKPANLIPEPQRRHSSTSLKNLLLNRPSMEYDGANEAGEDYLHDIRSRFWADGGRLQNIFGRGSVSPSGFRRTPVPPAPARQLWPRALGRFASSSLVHGARGKYAIRSPSKAVDGGSKAAASPLLTPRKSCLRRSISEAAVARTGSGSGRRGSSQESGSTCVSGSAKGRVRFQLMTDE